MTNHLHATNMHLTSVSMPSGNLPPPPYHADYVSHLYIGACGSFLLMKANGTMGVQKVANIAFEKLRTYMCPSS